LDIYTLYACIELLYTPQNVQILHLGTNYSNHENSKELLTQLIAEWDLEGHLDFLTNLSSTTSNAYWFHLGGVKRCKWLRNCSKHTAKSGLSFASSSNCLPSRYLTVTKFLSEERETEWNRIISFLLMLTGMNSNIKKGKGYNRGSELVKRTLYTSMELSQWNPFVLLMNANKFS
jgi:hypothetical protein